MINAQLGRIQVIKISMNTIEVSDTLWAFNNVKYDSCKELIGGANELCQKCKKKKKKWPIHLRVVRTQSETTYQIPLLMIPMTKNVSMSIHQGS